MEKKVVFKGWALPLALLIPQLVITGLFTLLPGRLIGRVLWG